MNDNVVQWLLEDSNPAVKYRTKTELINLDYNSQDVKSSREQLLLSDDVKSALSFFQIGKAYADAYAFSALAEYGLTRHDINIDDRVEKYIANYGFNDGCGEGFLLRNLIALGYYEHPLVNQELKCVLDTQQSDGGYPCVSKNPKIKKPNVPHKSCFQMTTSYLLLAAELYKIKVIIPQTDNLVKYFLEREILYRHDNKNQVVKAEMGITFHPPVATRIGLHMIMYALSVLHRSGDPACNRAWNLLESKCNDDGRYIIEGSLTKPYIKTEKPGKPSKWVTFYSLLAKQQFEKQTIKHLEN